MIAELLTAGIENAITGRALARVLDCDMRTITAQIERERRNGAPICAKSRGKTRGYYLAADQSELNEYCNALQHRAGQLFKTRGALLKILPTLPNNGEGAEYEQN